MYVANAPFVCMALATTISNKNVSIIEGDGLDWVVMCDLTIFPIQLVQFGD